MKKSEGKRTFGGPEFYGSIILKWGFGLGFVECFGEEI